MLNFLKESRSLVVLLVCLPFIALFNGYMYISGKHVSPRPFVKEIFTPPRLNKVRGNPNAEITIVEFFDYNCPFTRKMEPLMRRMVAQNKSIRIIYRAYNHMGGTSELAALAALSANFQDRYLRMHDVLLSKPVGELSQKNMLYAAKNIGMNTNRFVNDMARPALLELVKNNKSYADNLGLFGTPSFLIAKSKVVTDPDNPNYRIIKHVGVATKKEFDQYIDYVRGISNDDGTTFNPLQLPI